MQLKQKVITSLKRKMKGLETNIFKILISMYRDFDESDEKIETSHLLS